MKEKIFIVCPDDSQSGAEQVLRLIANTHADYGDEVHVFFIKERRFGYWDFLEQKHVRLYFTTAKKERHGVLPLIRKLRKISRVGNKIDRVYTSHAHMNGLIDLMRVAGILRARYHIARESTSIFRRFKGIKHGLLVILYKTAYRKIDLLICQTVQMKNHLLEDMPALKSLKVRVIPNPIDIQELHRSSAKEIPMEYRPIMERKPVVLAGRLIPLKGFDLLLQAYKMLEDAISAVIILGEGPDLERLTALADQLEISDRVVFAGYQANPMPFFKEAGMCVVSSITEGFPNTLLQMMAVNDNVVSTRCAGGIEDIPGIYTCETSSVTALKDAMKRCWDQQHISKREEMNLFLDTRSRMAFMERILNSLKHE
jgi:glycosyltransferase involved in cell wall biosynthesis